MYLGLSNLGLNQRNSFDPLSLFAAGEQGGLYDISDFATLSQDSAGNTPVTTTGQPVGKILDKSGRGNHRTQGTAASRPTLQKDSSGYYYLSYDGVDDWQSTTIDLSATTVATGVFGVYKASDAAQGVFCEHGLVGTDADAASLLYAPVTAAANFGNVLRGGGTGGVTTASSFAAPYPAVATSVLSRTGTLATQATLLLNGEATSVATGSTSTAANFASRTCYFGRRGTGTFPFNGREYASIIIGRALTATETTLLQQWAGQHMGIAL